MCTKKNCITVVVVNVNGYSAARRGGGRRKKRTTKRFRNIVSDKNSDKGNTMYREPPNSEEKIIICPTLSLPYFWYRVGEKRAQLNAVIGLDPSERRGENEFI